jgi:ubiquinone/menaquinone biosynthesis C-methylase UbiE
LKEDKRSVCKRFQMPASKQSFTTVAVKRSEPSSNPMPSEAKIGSRWEAIPVGENVIGALHTDFGGDYTAFFEAYDRWLYTNQSHILYGLDQFDWGGKRVLEIGLGQGADSEQLVRRGATWSGIDLTRESVQRVKKRFELRGLPRELIMQGSAVRLPFSDNVFDMIYSHGVLHHVPEILAAQAEIYRVLKDDGRLIIMVYARNSLNYQLSIKWLRRFGLMVLFVLPVRLDGIYGEHKRRAQQMGLMKYLKLDNFISRSTDGPANPYSKVYDRKSLLCDFPSFEVIRTFKLWMHAPPLPVHGFPGEGLLGWHLWAELKPRTGLGPRIFVK